MFEICRRVRFAAGHRVWGHESECANLHGHNYTCLFHARSSHLDAIGRVIDFGELNRRLAPWINEKWDHGMILFRDDREAIAAIRRLEGQKLFLLDSNPTAENLASHLLNVVAREVFEGSDIQVFRVELWETPNCFAVCEL
jgi:6-pyruvoyltetrahydropterin/6-carboxytetrahydropterin synthase